MMATAAAIALLLLVPAPAPHVVTGVVRDPQDRPVQARVRLACGDDVRSVETGTDGRFSFAAVAGIDGCTLRVEQDGAIVYETRVDAAQSDGLIVRLPVRVTQQVEVVAPQPAPSPSLSITVMEEEFSRIAATTAQLIEHARQLAGSSGAPAIYVDGLPATTLPPITQIAVIRVNADPFSAEYAHGDVPTIQIVTKAPARVFGAQFGSEGFAFGERNTLDPEAHSSSTGMNAIVSGPVPRLPLGFRLDAALSRREEATPIRALLPAGTAAARAATVTARNDGSSTGVDVFYSGRGTMARTVVRESRTSGTNAGVGGLTLAEAGTSHESRGREIRVTVNRTADRYLHDTGVLVVTSGSETRANSAEAGVFIPGALTMGGSAISHLHSDRVTWTIKQTVRSTSNRPWTAGVAAAGSHLRSELALNPFGQLQFGSLDAYEAARRGEPSGTLLLSRGLSARRYGSVTVAPFVQRVLARTSHIEVVGGLRADLQQEFGMVLSPRLTVGGRWNALTVAFGSGVFARNVSDTTVLSTLERDGRQQQQFVAPAASLLDLSPSDLTALPMLRARLDDELTRPREVMHRVAIERRVGRLSPALELTWTRETHRLGFERVRDGEDWIDVLQSNRESRRQRVLALLRYTRASQHVSASYVWTRARDNGGAAAFAPRGSSLSDEWAPSAGIAPHTFTVLGTLALPGGVSLNVNEMWSSGSPFNITTGLDTDGNGLFVDRGGRRRNSGRGSMMQSLSLYGYKRLRVPATIAGHRLHASVGVQAANLLNTRNVTSFGSVAGTGTLGRPLAALPGRSVRTFFTID